jgi:putative transposase
VQCREAHRGVLVGEVEPPRWIADGAGRRVAPRTVAGAPFTRRAEGDPVSDDLLCPHDHAEAVALFRAEVIGALDNGPLYSGAQLRLACERLGITLLHARPYDAPARGKMERFWRTLREGCLDHLGTMTQLHDVQARLLAFLDEHHHRAPHGGLFGKRPAEVWASATLRAVDEAELATALTMRVRRRVRRDGTLDIDGAAWQLDQSFLAGAVVTVAVDMTGTAAPVVEHDDRRYLLRPVDTITVGKTRRRRPPPERATTVPFDPSGALLDRVASRKPRHRLPEEG